MKLAAWVQILDKAICVSLHVWEKGIKSIISLFPSMGEIVEQTVIFHLGEGNSELKQTLLKNWYEEVGLNTNS